jgi:GAF domain-containing protein
VTFLVSAIAIWGTVRGLGPFAREQVNESLILIQLFMAVVAATGMFLAAAVTESRRAGRRASAQYASARILAEAGTREEALRLVLECVRVELEWDAAAFWVAEENEGVLRLIEVCSDPSFRMPEQGAESRGRRCARGVGLAGSVWAAAKPLWMEDVPDENRSLQRKAASRQGCQGVLAVPVLLGGEVFGVMEFFSREIRPPDDDLLEMTTAIGRQIGQFLEKRSAEEALLRSEERYRAFIQKSSEGIWRCEVAQPITTDLPEDEQIDEVYRRV